MPALRHVHLIALTLLSAAPAWGQTVPLTIESPGGGEVFLPGQVQVVRVNKKNQPLITKVEFSSDNGTTFTVLGQINKKNPNADLRLSLEWTVPTVISSTCLIRVQGILSSSKQAEGSTKLFSIGNGGFIIGALGGDHGALDGLLDDDHTQYLNRDGSRPMTGALNLGGQNITAGKDANFTGILTTGTVLTGGFGVTGASTLSGLVSANGNISANAGIDVMGGNLTVGGSNFLVAPGTGNTSIAGTLGVTGITTLAGTLNTNGAVSVNNGLNVAGPNFTVGTTQFSVNPATGNTMTLGTVTANAVNVTGTQVVLDSDNAGAGVDVSIIAEQGTGQDGIIKYDTMNKRWEISNDGLPFAPIALNSPAGGANADTLDALDSTSFLRSDAGGALSTGTLTISTTATLLVAGVFDASTASSVLFKNDSISDAMVSNTLTASDLVAGSQVVSDAEVDDNLTITGGTVNSTPIGASTPSTGAFTTLTASTDDATTNSVINVLTIIHSTSGSAANGIGTGVLLRTEDTGGTVEDAAQIAGVLTNANDGAEASALRFFTRTAGGALTQGMELDATGSLSVVGNLTVTGTLTSSGTSLSGSLNMQNNVIQNIGVAGTDFTATGGLTLADDLDMTNQPIVNIGAIGTFFTVTGGLTLADTLDMSSKPIMNIGAAGTDFTITGGLTLADTLTVTAGSVNLPMNSVGDAAVVDNLTISGGMIDNTIIGGNMPASAEFTTVRASAAGTNTVYLGTMAAGGTGPLLQLRNGVTDCFVVSSTGNLGLATAPTANPIEAVSGAFLSPAGVWTDVSDRNQKTNFTPVSGAEILERLGNLPITSWNYKVESPETRHIGPMAQDFYALFRLGSNDTTLAPLDTTGIALAAIQELKKEKDRLAAENQELKARQAALDARLARLEAACPPPQAP